MKNFIKKNIERCNIYNNIKWILKLNLIDMNKKMNKNRKYIKDDIINITIFLIK